MGFGVEGSGLRVESSGFGVEVLGFEFGGLGLRVEVSGFGFWGSGFRDSGYNGPKVGAGAPRNPPSPPRKIA